MKKVGLLIVAIFMCIFCMPIFSACGGEGSSELQTIRFTQDVYEADLDQPFELTYKVNPTTASNYSVRFDFLFPNDYPSSFQAYLFDSSTHMFTIKAETFPPITAYIYYGSGSEDYDTCTIQLKTYPTQFYFEKSVDTIYAGETYNLVLKAKVNDKIVSIDRSWYNIELTTSAPNIIALDPINMVAISTGLSGTVRIEARIKMLSGVYWGQSVDQITGNVAKIDLTVIDPVDYAVVALEGQDEFINTTKNYEQTANNTYVVNSDDISLKVLMYSAKGECINSNYLSVSVKTDNANVFVSENAGEFSIDLSAVPPGLVCVQISSTVVNSSRNPTVFIFYLLKENNA